VPVLVELRCAQAARTSIPTVTASSTLRMTIPLDVH
jgi:hypothetical protein